MRGSVAKMLRREAATERKSADRKPAYKMLKAMWGTLPQDRKTKIANSLKGVK